MYAEGGRQKHTRVFDSCFPPFEFLYRFIAQINQS
jgi:hypothetical protein